MLLYVRKNELLLSLYSVSAVFSSLPATCPNTALIGTAHKGWVTKRQDQTASLPLDSGNTQKSYHGNELILVFQEVIYDYF